MGVVSIILHITSGNSQQSESALLPLALALGILPKEKGVEVVIKPSPLLLILLQKREKAMEPKAVEC